MRFVANVDTSALASFEAATGAMTLLSGLPGAAMDDEVTVRGDFLWFVERQAGLSTLKRIRRDGEGGATVVHASASLTRWRVSSDGTTVLLTEHGDGVDDPVRLSKTPSDGSAPPTLIEEGRLTLSDRLIEKAAGQRVVISIGQEDGSSTSRLIDDVTGATIDEFAGMPDTLSSDGTEAYELHACRLGDVQGSEVRRLTHGAATLLPCQVSVGDTLVPVPQQNSVLVVGDASVMLLEP